MRSEESVTFGEYEEILGLQQWAAVEDEFVRKHELLSVPAAKAS